uniref:Cation ABC transporter substrate-binding protein n=1 Tax=uncultured Helicobacter sp. TaxID=175537 RepID=A0A650F395_9HELI|nr:cation ABC transporter substrate-binding protein [uncultured Helicobacter sp.]
MIKIFLSVILLMMLYAPIFAQSSTIHIIVSVLPQKNIVERIGGDFVKVEVLVPKGKSPEIYEPNITQMKTIQNARIFFGVGMPFELKWHQRFLNINPQLNYLNLAESALPLHEHDSHDHRHNPHVWLSLTQIENQITQITRQLSVLDPSHKAIYESNQKQFLQEILTLKQSIQNVFDTPNTQKKFLVYHPAFEYFAQEFGLEELSIEHDGKELKGADLSKLIQDIRLYGLKVIFIQPQFSKQRVQMLAKELNMRIIELDPLQDLWLDSMQTYTCQIAFSLSEKESQACIKQYFKAQQ